MKHTLIVTKVGNIFLSRVGSYVLNFFHFIGLFGLYIFFHFISFFCTLHF
jgi:hypothetical protein